MKRVVFISHSSADRSVADRICTYLEQNGVGCWIAPRDVMPGKNYGAAIVDAIDECRVFVLILSSQSNKSRQVVREVERAASSDSVILPFRIEEVQPSRDLAFYVSSAHWLDAVKHPVDEQFDELLTAIRDWARSDTDEANKIPILPAPPVPLPSVAAPVSATPSARPVSALAVIVSVVLVAAIGIGAFVFYKMRSTSQEPSSVIEPQAIPSPTATVEPLTATPPEPSPTPTATETPSPTPVPSPTATPIRLKPGERLRPSIAPEPTIAPSPPPVIPRTTPPVNAEDFPPQTKRPIVREVAASSRIDTEHRPNYAFDGNPATGWATKGSGTGQTLFAHFKSPVLVRSVSILNGDGRDKGHYLASNRVKTLRILLSDGTNQLLTCKDELKMHHFELTKPVTASWAKFEIMSVYPGKTKQTGISEISFNEDQPDNL